MFRDMEKTELAEKASPTASVKSPAREALLRKGRGFSLAEIKKAGKTVLILKELNINIDYFRKSVHEWNVQQLKNLKPSKKKKEKKKTYLPKEERIKAKPKVKKKVVSVKEEEVVPELEDELFYEADDVEIVPKKIIKKTQPAPKVKTPAKAKPAPAIKTKTPKTAIKTKTPKTAIKTKTPEPAPKVKEEITGMPLTKLSGFGSATAKKFSELGIHNVEELLDEDAEELAMLISGVSADKIKKWIEEGKELLNK